MTYDRVYLLRHERSAAVKVGVARGSSRVAKHQRAGYQLVAQWQHLGHQAAYDTEQQTISWWRSNGWEQVDAAPADGRTETTELVHVAETLSWLVERLGATVAQ